MNQDQLKEKLLEIDGDVEDFNLLFSGKKSKKVNGLYHPEKREIIIHNKNFSSENDILYTAIHEFAHHIQYTKSKVPVYKRAHTTSFYSIFHKLLYIAEEKKIYLNIYNDDNDFLELSKKIRQNCIFTNSTLMKDFGVLLIEAMELCKDKNVRFEDYISRELLLEKAMVKSIMKISSMNISPEIGFENMKVVARIKDDDERKKVEDEFKNGKSPAIIKSEISSKRNNEKGEIEILESEQKRIRKTIETLSSKLENIENKLNELKNE